jgi:hypothetical protein
VLELDGIVSLAALALWIFCLIDVITTDESLVRNLSKTWWIVIVLFFSVIGSIIWLVAGRPQNRTVDLPYRGNKGFQSDRSSSGYSRAPRPAPVAPDDDPVFLAQVKRQAQEDARLASTWDEDLRRREDELRRREEELRRREGGAAPETS